jgi:hypothetical protein
MSTPIDSHAEETLTELAGRFEHWRQSRTHGRARIPEDLWDQAVALSMVLPNARVAKRLRLSPTVSENSASLDRVHQRLWKPRHPPRLSTSRRQCHGRRPHRLRPRSNSSGRMGHGCASVLARRQRRGSRWCGRFWRGLDVAADALKPVFLAVEPIDFRAGINRLAALCRERLAQNPLEGAVYVFRNRRSTALKLLLYDGQGFWLCTKRLSQGRFQWWPRAATDLV